MKNLLIILAVFVGFGPTCAQTSKKQFMVIAQNDNLGIKVIRTIGNTYENDQHKYYLVSKNRNKIDTLVVDTIHASWTSDTCSIVAKQLDGKGSKEIILAWSFHLLHTVPGHGWYDHNKTVEQIWNLDTKQKMFSAVTSWSVFSQYNDYTTDSTGQPVNEVESSRNCSYSYELTIGNTGKLIIKNTESKFSDTDCEKPDHEEGEYFLNNGYYILQKRK